MEAARVRPLQQWDNVSVQRGLGQSVIIIQFLKGKDAEEFSFLNRLEPDIKLFRFERENESYDCLLDSQKKEERQKNSSASFPFKN